MQRMRRLRLSYSSDDEEEDHQNEQHQPQQQETEPPQQNPAFTDHTVTTFNPNPNPSPPELVPISDDDFLDVSESFTPPSPPPAASAAAAQERSVEGPRYPIADVLQRMGLKLGREWLDSCLHGLESSVPGFSSLDVAVKAKLCFEQFMLSDMNYSGGGVLPQNVHSMHLVDLAGPFVLQVDEINNISCPLRSRYQEAPAGIKRCLKLSMTDGVQRVFGMEYRPIKGLDVLAPAGLKVAICNVHIRRGLLMLVPEALEVLGGAVEDLDAARQRLVYEVNKPPRGRRTRTGVIPPLATRATLAAWPLNGFNTEHTNTSTSQSAAPFQAPPRGLNAVEHANTPISHTRASFQMPLGGSNVVEHNNTSASQTAAPFQAPQNGINAVEHTSTPQTTAPVQTPLSGFNVVENTYTSTLQTAARFQEPQNVVNVIDLTHTSRSQAAASSQSLLNGLDMDKHTNTSESQTEAVFHFQADRKGATLISYNSNASERTVGETTVPISGVNDVPNPLPTVTSDVEEMHVDSVGSSRENVLSNSKSNASTDVADIDLVDEVEHPLILSGDREVPFTYLASLSAKWAATKEKAPSVKGKIKCFLTGVKGFQYKRRTSYELQCYVDDGSLISEIFIDHNLVQKGIGHSPQEVTAALTSSDTELVSGMKEILRQFQIFLVNFEGTMLVEINETSPLPIALEMTQGCAASDAWMLLRRLKSRASTQTPERPPLDPIEISP